MEKQWGAAGSEARLDGDGVVAAALAPSAVADKLGMTRGGI